jgi:hypothetical protein
MKTLAFFFAFSMWSIADQPLKIKVESFDFNNRTYREATILKIDEETVRVFHSKGVAKIPLELLPSKIQLACGYDAVAINEAKKAKQAASENEKLPGATGHPAFPLSIDCIAVKPFGGKYRWFFRLKNHGSETFRDSIKITLLNKTPPAINGEETFKATADGILPGLATVVFFESFTGPEDIHGDFCVANFSAQHIVSGVMQPTKTTGSVPSSLTE